MSKGKKDVYKELIKRERDDLYFKVLDEIESDNNYIDWLRFAGLSLEILENAVDNGIFAHQSVELKTIAMLGKDRLDELLATEYTNVKYDNIGDVGEFLENKNKDRSKLGKYEGVQYKDCIIEVVEDGDLVKITAKENGKIIKKSQVKRLNNSVLLDDAIDVMKTYLKLNGYKTDNVVIQSDSKEDDTLLN